MFKREYDTIDVNTLDTGIDTSNPYSGMQTAIFEMLDDGGRLCRWTIEDDLVECAEDLS